MAGRYRIFARTDNGGKGRGVQEKASGVRSQRIVVSNYTGRELNLSWGIELNVRMTWVSAKPHERRLSNLDQQTLDAL
jgi:hypothetical protein